MEEKQPSELAKVLASALAADTGEPRWSGNNYHPAHYQHMHALGVVAANYNGLEKTLKILFFVLAGEAMSGSSNFLFQKLSNNERLDLISRLYASQVKEAECIDRLDWFISGCGKCAENRNILMHSELQIPNALLSADVIFKLIKATKSGEEHFISLELAELRRVADDIYRFDKFGFDLVLYVATVRLGSAIKEFFGRRPTLPDKPVEPVLLKLHPVKDEKGTPPQPQASGE
jgi:hypothetical protein